MKNLSQSFISLYLSPEANFDTRKDLGDIWRDDVKKMPILLKTFGMSEDLLKEIKVPASTNWVKEGMTLADAHKQLCSVVKAMHSPENRSDEEKKKLEEQKFDKSASKEYNRNVAM